VSLIEAIYGGSRPDLTVIWISFYVFHLMQNTVCIAVQLFHSLVIDAASDFPVMFNLCTQLSIAYFLFTVQSEAIIYNYNSPGQD
jgi:hypothetical protein